HGAAIDREQRQTRHIDPERPKEKDDRQAHNEQGKGEFQDLVGDRNSELLQKDQADQLNEEKDVERRGGGGHTRSGPLSSLTQAAIIRKRKQLPGSLGRYGRFHT